MLARGRRTRYLQACFAILAIHVSILLSILLVPASASATLPEVLSNGMPEIVEWVYRNAAVEDPLPCEATCKHLWEVEQGPESASSQELWDELGELETSLGLWGDMAQIRERMGSKRIGPVPYRLGLELGYNSPHPKWMEIMGPREPFYPEVCSGPWGTTFAPPGQKIGISGPGEARSPGNEWYLTVCGNFEIVGNRIPALNPSAPEENCGGVERKFSEWVVQEWVWNECGEGFYEGNHVGAPETAQAFYQKFHFSRPQEWAHQEVAGGEYVENLGIEGASDPGVSAVENGTELGLGSDPTLKRWLAWELGGESGPNPLGASAEEGYGLENEAAPGRRKCLLGHPVDCATGNQVESQTDLAVGGRGLGMSLIRTYNSQLAAQQVSAGPFGFGWSSSYEAHLYVDEEQQQATVRQDNGSTARFFAAGEGWTPADPLVQATLKKEGGEYAYTLPSQRELFFNGSGYLVGERDRNGNELTVIRGEGERLSAVLDPSGRELKFHYDMEGRVDSATDPMGHTVKYAYEAGDLVSVTYPGEAKANWKFKYDVSHQMTEEIDGDGNAVVTEYDGSHRVDSQTDAMERTRTWEYPEVETGARTVIKEPNGSTTVEDFNSADEPTSVTGAYGSPMASTTLSEYNIYGQLISITDPNSNRTMYGYDPEGNRTGEIDPLGHIREWTYDSKHDVVSTRTRKGETTIVERDSHGNAIKTSRPAPSGEMQSTEYEYGPHGELGTVKDPIGRTTTYGYDANGDRTSEVDAEGDKRSWTYDEDSGATSSVSARGNALGAEPAPFTTTVERDAQGRPSLVLAPGPGAGEPSNAARPVISGLAMRGQILTAGTGVWDGSPSMTYTYQWRRCDTLGESCSNISGATEASYQAGGADVGSTLRLAVQATNPAGSATSESRATSVIGGSAPTFFARFGSFGSGPGQLREPRGVALGGGDLFVADEVNSRVEVFGSNGEFVRSIGSAGSGSGQLSGPRGVAVDSAGNVWVVDSGNSRIEEFTSAGSFVRVAGSVGSGSGQFKEAKGIAVDGAGNVWVADTGDNRLEVFDNKAEYLGSVGFPGEFKEPRALAVGPEGNVWVADTGDDRVVVLNGEGEYEGAFGSTGSGEGQFEEPKGITVGPDGGVWVVDTGNDRVEMFNTEGEYVGQFGAGGSKNGQLDEPWGIQVDSKGSVYVADSENNRIQKFVSSGAPLNTATSAIGGQMLVGQSLKVGTGTWSAVPNPTFGYQWRRCNTAGAECTNISGATSAIYTAVEGDINHKLRVLVTATNAQGSSSSFSSATETIGQAHVAEYAYDPAGNLTHMTDPEGRTTTYFYDNDNELTEVENPDGSKTETKYDELGHVIEQVDGNAHVTKYVRNLLGEVTESTDPLGRKTTKEYDFAGNLEKLVDAAGRTTTYEYDGDRELKKVTYSEEGMHDVEYSYDADGNRVSMVDGTGTTSYAYDQLDRLEKVKDGHGAVVGYTYDLDNEPIGIEYPGGHSVSQKFDKADRLDEVADWLGHKTTFAYDADSDLIDITFPSGTSEKDSYTYDDARGTRKATMGKGEEVLASLTYSRDSDEQVTSTLSSSLPSAATTESSYDPNSRLESYGGVPYEYDKAGNLVHLGSNTSQYDEADELESSTGVSYKYDEVGERTETAPASGPATAYGYDQAGNLLSVKREAEGPVTAVNDHYEYNGDGLRIAQTVGGSTSHLTWDYDGELPLLLGDEGDFYVYGLGGLPIEQINNTTGTVTYLHHDQAGSTRLLTSSTGTVTGKCTYGAYGTPTCEGSTTTPLGFDGEYTSPDTGLIYMRARTYDPTTAQFLSVDPLEKLTRAPYNFAEDNPLNESDPTGLGNWLGLGIPSPGEVLFPGGGSTQVCVGGTVSLGVTVSLEGCYVHTPHGEGITITPSVGFGAGAAVNGHFGIGESNACRPSEYGGLFNQVGGSAEFGTGGYYNRFSNFPYNEFSGSKRVEGWTTGGSVGLGAEGGGGISDTVAIPLGGGGSGSSGCGCS